MSAVRRPVILRRVMCYCELNAFNSIRIGELTVIHRERLDDAGASRSGMKMWNFPF